MSVLRNRIAAFDLRLLLFDIFLPLRRSRCPLMPAARPAYVCRPPDAHEITNNNAGSRHGTA